jgi:ssDNA-binding Zn-finger/Zn-ribbon topoisomerase 1
MKVRQNDELISNPNIVVEEWKNKFAQLYNQNNNVNDFDELFYREAIRIVNERELEMEREQYDENGEINGDITLDELRLFLAKLKNKKACGIDGIPNEILKNPKIINILTNFMNMCFSFNIIPSLWVKSIIKPIPKSSSKDPYIPLNYRGISLLSCTSKVLSGILNTRICKYCEFMDLIVDEQNGFRKKRSCEEHIFTLTSLIKKRINDNMSTFVALIDLEKAFDCIDRTLLLYRLLCNNIDGKVYKIIKRMYTNTTSCLKLNNIFTDWFEVTCGVRQGDNLSPTLFSLLINDLANYIKQLNKGIKLRDDNISILLYADDMVLIAKNETDLQYMLDAMNEWMKKWRLKVNINKSNVMHFRPKRKACSRYDFKYNGQEICKVSSYKYLGVYLDEHMDFNKCSQVLSESASRALGGVINKFKLLRDCGYKTFTKLFETGVLSILNYGAEIWGYGNFPKCDNVMNRAMRYFLGVHRFAPTAALHGDMAWISLKYTRYIAMLRFWNRLIKMDNSRLTKRVFLWCHDFPDNTYCGDVKKISDIMNLSTVYHTKGLFNIEQIKQTCKELMHAEWQDEVQSKPKLRTYKIMKANFEVEPYVNYHVSKHIRSILAQLRMGILPLHIETGRYQNVFDRETGVYRRMNVDERTCNICKLDVVEDEIHFLFHCNMYQIERRAFYGECNKIIQNVKDMNDDDKLKHIMMYKVWKITLRYVNLLWEKRKSLEFV